MTNINKTIGYNLKLIRTKFGMTLDQVAGLTDVSKSMIGQIERGESTPTVKTLWKLCNGLKISFSSLLEEDTNETVIINKKTLSSLSEEETHNLYSFIPFSAARKFEAFNMELLSRAKHQSEPHLGAYEEFVYILAGEVEIIVGNESNLLNKGDLFKFNAGKPHVYKNNTDNLVEMFIIIVYQ